MPMKWKISPEPVDYEEAVAFMETRARRIREGTAGELVWLLEHPALYTAGSSADEADLIDTLGLPVHKTGRGGQYTYHGPDQRVAYVMLDLKKRTPDVRAYVQNLERWIIATLATFGIESFTRDGRVGVWVDTKETAPLSRIRGEAAGDNPAGEVSRSETGGSVPPTTSEAKIAALGVRIRQWVTYHGIAINVNPDLSHYRGIVPCGIREYGITSMQALGISSTMENVDRQLRKAFDAIF